MLGLTTLLVSSVVLGAVGPLDNVGMRVVAPRIVPERDLPSANGLLSMGDQFPYLVGPALAGAFVGVQAHFRARVALKDQGERLLPVSESTAKRS